MLHFIPYMQYRVLQSIFSLMWNFLLFNWNTFPTTIFSHRWHRLLLHFFTHVSWVTSNLEAVKICFRFFVCFFAFINLLSLKTFGSNETINLCSGETFKIMPIYKMNSENEEERKSKERYFIKKYTPELNVKMWPTKNLASKKIFLSDSNIDWTV